MARTGTDPHPTTGRPWWGTAAAATQCEGAAPRSDWAGWEAEGRVPASGDGNGFRTRFEDDLALLAAHGLRHHRLTVEWVRLEPHPGRWHEDEVAHLRRVLTAARDAGVEAWVCLLHGTAPGWFTDDERGWLDDRAVLRWARHVDRVAEAIGDLVPGWVPIHEPELTARLGYGEGLFPPGRRDEDDERTARTALLAAEAEAARLLRSGPAPVAVTARPGVERHGDDLLVVPAPVDELARALERTAEVAEDARLLVLTGDPAAGEAGGAPPWADRDGAGRDEERDEEVDEEAEEREGARSEAEERRAERLQRAVEAVDAAVAGGLRIVGAWHQPAIDGYEWHRGFAARLGLFDRDREPRPALEVLPVERGSPATSGSEGQDRDR
jgi:beta-glucosidase